MRKAFSYCSPHSENLLKRKLPTTRKILIKHEEKRSFSEERDKWEARGNLTAGLFHGILLGWAAEKLYAVSVPCF